jgi:hypothetical protein
MGERERLACIRWRSTRRERVPACYLRAGRSFAVVALAVLPACDLGRSGEESFALFDEDAGGPVGPTGQEPPSGGNGPTGSTGDAAVDLDAATAVPVEGSSDAGAIDASVRDADADADAEAAPVDASATDADLPEASAVEAGEVGEAGADASALPAAIGAWSFDEGTGTESADLSGNGHPAVFVGGASWGAGKAGSGLALNGVSAYADVGVPLVDTHGSFTVLAWGKLASLGSWEVAVSEDYVRGSAFGLKMRGDGTHHFDFDLETSDVTSPGFLVATSASTAQNNVWVHLAGVYDAVGAKLKVYVNGALESSTVADQPFAAAPGHFVIGRGLYNGAIGSYFHGTIDQVAAYDRALSDAQVAAIFAGP